MKKEFLFLFLLPYILFSNEKNIASEIKAVTVYLNGAQIKRTAPLYLKPGRNTIVLSGLSSKIDESSIGLSGLKAVSVLSMDYDIDYLEKPGSDPLLLAWKDQMLQLEREIAFLMNSIIGLKEEEKVITSNRTLSTGNHALSLEKLKEISQYYRKRVTEIKNNVFESQLKITELKKRLSDIESQLAAEGNAPQRAMGKLVLTLDAPMATGIELILTYLVNGAGWAPNYDIRSHAINTPLTINYKANIYQNTGVDWSNVPLTLSTDNPSFDITKPDLEPHYLNFGPRRTNFHTVQTTKKGYVYNPAVKKVTGRVTEGSGAPLPGVNVRIAGTAYGTQTDFDGNYSLDIPYGEELTFDYLGFHSQQIPIYASIINVRMEDTMEALEEVVMTGNSSAVEDELQGSAAGIRVRGIGSISTQDPLIVVDGVPMEGLKETDLDPNEVQDLEILKGPEAQSLYGDRGRFGVILITTKKSSMEKKSTKTEFRVKKRYSIQSTEDFTTVEINSFKLPAAYAHFAVPLMHEQVFLTATFTDWERHQLLPGEATIYFEGTYAGKTVIAPYTTKKEMVLSLGIDPNITISRREALDFKSKSFTGNSKIADKAYRLEVKNNKNTEVVLKLMDRIPQSQNKEIKVGAIEVGTAELEPQKGLLTWEVRLQPNESWNTEFSYQVKYPRGRYISF